MPDSIFVKDADGGVVVEMDLPLPEAVAGRLATGSLRQCDADGNLLEEPRPARPANNAPKSEWVGYHVRAHGVDQNKAAGMTKQDIIDRVNALES